MGDGNGAQDGETLTARVPFRPRGVCFYPIEAGASDRAGRGRTAAPPFFLCKKFTEMEFFSFLFGRIFYKVKLR